MLIRVFDNLLKDQLEDIFNLFFFCYQCCTRTIQKRLIVSKGTIVQKGSMSFRRQSAIVTSVTALCFNYFLSTVNSCAPHLFYDNFIFSHFVNSRLVYSQCHCHVVDSNSDFSRFVQSFCEKPFNLQ
jgi:hypothetical protein